MAAMHRLRKKQALERIRWERILPWAAGALLAREATGKTEVETWQNWELPAVFL